MKRKIALILILILVGTLLCACSDEQLWSEKDRVSHNVSKEANNFNVTRRITVFNIRTDTVLMQMTGRFAIENNSTRELVVIAEVEKGTYQKHFIYLNDYTMYTVEDLSGAEVSPYSYELEFLPQMLAPVKITAHELAEDLK